MTDTAAREKIALGLAGYGYIADRDLTTALWLMDMLHRPLLLEGEAGVGKTEVARALASLHDTKLIRLQCYEGLDQNAALFEWNYQRQSLAIKARGGTIPTQSRSTSSPNAICSSGRSWRRSGSRGHRSF
jgi:MoxR-like ATPase